MRRSSFVTRRSWSSLEGREAGSHYAYLTYILTLLTLLTYLPYLLTYLLGGFCKFRLSTAARETTFRDSKQSSNEPPVASRRSAIVGRRSSVGDWRSAIVGRRSSVADPRSAIVGRRSSVGDCRSATGDGRSAIDGLRSSLLDRCLLLVALCARSTLGRGRRIHDRRARIFHVFA